MYALVNVFVVFVLQCSLASPAVGLVVVKETEF